MGRLPAPAGRPIALVAAALCAGSSWAQEVGGAGGLRVTAGVMAEQLLTEVRSRPSGDNGLESTTRLSPGLQVSSRSGRVRGSLSYTADLVHRRGRHETAGSEVLNGLNASFVAEAVPNWAYVDARASVSQQSLSAFGRPADNGTTANANRAEVGTVSLSPYARGPIGAYAEYEARWTASATRTRNSTAPGSDSETALLNLSSPRRATLLGWGLTATRQRTSFETTTRDTVSDRAIASIFFNPNPELQLAVNGGQEANDVGSVQRERYENYGASLRWTPSPRTLLVVDGQERYFGRSHRLQLQYRTPRSTWSYVDSRDVTNGADTTGSGQTLTLYQVMDLLLLAQFPDPTERDLRVRDAIAALGGRPDDVVAAGTLAGGVSVQRRQDLSFALQGIRTTIAVQAFRSDSRRIQDAASLQPVDLEPVEQSGYNATVSHRLTPQVSVALLGSRVITHSTATRPGVDQKSASFSLTSQLGRRTTGALRAGYTVFNSPTAPSRETSLAASISLRF